MSVNRGIAYYIISFSSIQGQCHDFIICHGWHSPVNSRESHNFCPVHLLVSSYNRGLLGCMFRVFLLTYVSCGIICAQMLWENKIGVFVWYPLMLPLGVYYFYKLVEVSTITSYKCGHVIWLTNGVVTRILTIQFSAMYYN